MKWSAQKINTQIVFMTFHADEDLMRAAMDVGGKGYLLKGSETDEVARRYTPSAPAAPI